MKKLVLLLFFSLSHSLLAMDSATWYIPTEQDIEAGFLPILEYMQTHPEFTYSYKNGLHVYENKKVSETNNIKSTKITQLMFDQQGIYCGISSSEQSSQKSCFSTFTSSPCNGLFNQKNDTRSIQKQQAGDYCQTAHPFIYQTSCTTKDNEIKNNLHKFWSTNKLMVLATLAGCIGMILGYKINNLITDQRKLAS